MALVDLLNVPRSDEEWRYWSWSHLDSHRRIRGAIQSKYGVTIIDYTIHPIYDNDIPRFLERNAQMHTEIAGTLNVQSVDLQSVDLNDEKQKIAWVFLHFQEHQSFENVLKIG